MSVPRRALGAGWEQVVRLYLEQQGWQILDVNYRSPFGELDIVALEPTKDGPVGVFVEVRARRSRRYGTPAESVSGTKQARLLATAYQWLAEHAMGEAEPACRFDVAAVSIGSNGNAKITLFRGAFDASP